MKAPTDSDPVVRVRRLLEGKIPFNRFLGIRIVELREGLALVELPFRPEFIGDPDRPALHGGVISTLIDFCGGAATWTTCGAERRVSTIDMRVDYLRPGRGETLFAEGRVVRVGNRVGVVDVIAFHGATRDEPVATGKCVYNIKAAGAAK